MDPSICPFCHLAVASSELERHANDHFDEYEQARDIALAQEIAHAPTTPPHNPVLSKNHVGRNAGFGLHCDKEIDTDEKISCLIGLQMKGDFFRVEHSLITMLRNRLESDAENSVSLLSGPLDHFQSLESEDVGWGCGWRNIQMLSSHLLMQRQEAKEVLFGGSGFVPDIASLQRWLEIAWEKGFDAVGSAHFEHKIYGSAKWIGTTECATLLRSFGIRARIVDFSHNRLNLMEPMGKTLRVIGPMDRYLIRRSQDTPQVGFDIQEECSSSESVNGLLSSTCSSNYREDNSHTEKYQSGKYKGHQILVDWVWNYFCDNKFTKSGNCAIIVDKAPLYFQHDGHSRIIVGIQVKHLRNRMEQHNLLIFDPAHRTEALERSLKDNFGWQNLIKRGVHSLKQQQYQICYIDPGVACRDEMERLKKLDSVPFEY